MIYNDNEALEYKVKFYFNRKTGRSPVKNYIDELGNKEKAKVLKYIEFLSEQRGILDEPYTKHIRGKIRELRVDFSNQKHRLFYFTFVGRTIILLHAFLKKTPKTPNNEIKRAENYYLDVLNNKEIYEN